MDYAAHTLQFNSQMNYVFNEILFEQMERESTMIMESLSTGVAVLEATDPQGNKQQFFAKIIEFLKRIFKAFTDKVRALFTNHKAWLDKNYTRFDSINYEGLEIEMVPFWNHPVNELRSKADGIAAQVRKVVNDPNAHERYKDFEALKTEVFKQYLDENGDLTNGLKNYFRMGSATGPLKAERLSGATLRDRVISEFRVYCSNYDKEVLPMVQKQVNDSEKDINMINRILSRRPATEQFVLLENAILSDTELAFLPVQEAEGDNAKQTPSKVTVTDHGSAENAEKHETLSSMSSSELVFMKNVAQARNLIVTSLMTVCEERFNAYMTALRQIMNARAPKKEKAAPESADNVNVKEKK